MRKCAVTGQRLDRRKLVRFVVDPEMTLVADLTGGLPGSGVWVSATRSAMDRVAGSRYLSRRISGPVRVPDGLADLVEDQLRKRCLDLLGLARRADQFVCGGDAVRRLFDLDKVGVLILAADASESGRGKLRRIGASHDRTVPVIETFDAVDLGAAVGRDNVVHAALTRGRLAEKFLAEADRYAGLREIAASDPAGSS